MIVSPTTVALNPQQGAAVPALKVGDIIEAKVLELLGQSIAKLAVGKSVIEVQTQVPLTPGSMVRLAVKNTPDGLRLTLLPNAANAGGPSAPSNPGTAAQATAGAGEAAGAPGQSPVTTGAVAGANTSTPAGVTISTNAAELPSPTQAQPSNPAAAAQAAIATAVQSSAARQGSLAPLLADAGVAAIVPTLPEPVRQAAERLLALQPMLDETISADGLKQAVNRSGLFLEAHLASDGMQAAANGAAAPPADDVKAALIVLRNVLKTWLAADPAAALTPGTATPRPAALMDLVRAALAPLPENAAPPAQDGAPPAAPHASTPTPPPPYRGAPTAAQPAAAPSISTDMAPRDIGKVLLGETDAAIARQTLLQAASLPDHL